MSISEKPGAIVPYQRSNPCATPGYFEQLSTGVCGCRGIDGHAAMAAHMRQNNHDTKAWSSAVCWCPSGHLHPKTYESEKI